MAADQERADRIRALKDERPDLTWKDIADAVGVTERAAAEWARSGGMDPKNARKLAEVFRVHEDYIWRGEQSDTPDLMSGPLRAGDAAQLDRIEAKLDALVEWLTASDAADRIEAAAELLRLVEHQEAPAQQPRDFARTERRRAERRAPR
jgi:transcriptional regulator with XRE-family HTH domain